MKKILLILFTAVLLFSSCRKSEKAGSPTAGEESGEPQMLKPVELRKNVDLSESAIDYFDADKDAAKYEAADFQAEDDTPFAIVDYGPTEELPVEMKRPTIYVLFSQPVVPLARLGEVMTSSPVMKIEPEMSGIYRWYGTKLLSFEPDEKYLPQREYRVTVERDTRSLGGKKLAGKREFSFHTEYLDIVELGFGQGFITEYRDYSETGVPVAVAKRIMLSFSYPVNLGVIKNFLKVTSAGKNFQLTLSRLEDEKDLDLANLDENFLKRIVILNMKENFEENSPVFLTLLKGARSETNLLGRPDEVVKQFQTIRPFAFKKHRTYSYSFPRSERGDSNPIYLDFTHPLDKETVLGNISVSLPAAMTEENITVWKNVLKISNLSVEYDSTYTIRIDEGLKDIYGRPLRLYKSIEIEVPDATRYYYFPDTGTRMLEAAFPPKIIYEYQNVFDGVWRIDSIGDPYRSLTASNLVPYDFSSLEKNTKHYEILDLSPWLNEDKKGFVGINWNFSKKDKEGLRREYGTRNLQVQVTDLGVTTRYAYNKVLVLVASLSTGNPVKGADVYLKMDQRIKKQGKTDRNGLAVFEFQEGEYTALFYDSNRSDRMRIRIEKESDKVELRPNNSHNPYHFGIRWTSSIYSVQEERMETFIFTDRGLYRPGETVTFRGIDRNLKLGSYSVYEGPYSLRVKEDRYKAEPFIRESGQTTDSGGFYGSFQLPEDLAPGYYTIEYSRGGGRRQESFQVAHFRRLNFSVSITKPDIQYFSGDDISARVRANYLAGGSLGGSEYSYYWTRRSRSFRPPGTEWKDYRFGPAKYEGTTHISSDSGRLNILGEANIKQKTEAGIKGSAYRYDLEVRVEDIDRQMVAARIQAVVHPATFYIGAKIASAEKGWWSPFVPQGKKMEIDYALVRPDGELFTEVKDRPLKIKFYRVTWKVALQKGVYRRIQQRWERVEELEYENEISLKKPTGSIDLTPKESGSYFIEFESSDGKERPAYTRLSFYSTGSSWVNWRLSGANDINLVPDKQVYAPGESVKLLVQSPLPRGKYLLSIEREGILEEKIIELEGSANTIDIQVTEEYIPIFYAALVSYSRRTQDPPKSYFEPDLGKPKGYFGIARIMVSNEAKEIKLEIKPSRKNYLPGEEAEVTVTASLDGKPLPGAEITFLAVDRGVLDLIDYHVRNPIDFFYSADKFPLGVSGADSRSLLMNPVTYEVKDLPGGEGEDEKMKKRKDFRPTAVFKPYLKTDNKGTVRVRFKLPDTLTAYRCTAMAVKKNTFGMGEQEFKVQNPINVRTALTRKLRVRDTSFAGVIVTNLDTIEHEVTVSLSSDLIKIDGSPEKKVNVPANTAVEVPFKLLALNTGEARLLFTIKSDILKEQLEDTLIIEKPLVKEAFTTIGKTSPVSGTADKGLAEEGLIIPSAIAEGYGGITVTLDSTRMASLSESIRYLFDYPYGCLEQRTSRILPLVLWGDKIIPFGLESKVNDVRGTVEKEMADWANFQNADGGFPFWLRGGRPSSLYSSIKVAHILHFAEQNGYRIPSRLDERKLLKYISNLTNEYVSLYLKLYSAYVQSLYGIDVTGKARDLLNEGDKIGLSGYGFLGLAFFENKNLKLARASLGRIKNFIKVGTRTIDLVETYENRYYFDSEVEQLALLLMLYHKLDPGSDFIEKITNTLMKRQKHGYWVNTSDTGWALQALARIYGEEAGEKTDFAARVEIDKNEILNTPFKGISRRPLVREFPFSEAPLSGLTRDKLFRLSFSRQGPGKLFYTATIHYALPTEVVRPRDEGFSVFTEIFDLDGNVRDYRDLELGETYRMRVIVSSSKRRNFVALRAPIPSGAEILDASFVTTAAFTEKGGLDRRSWERETVYGDEYGFVDEGVGFFSEGGYYPRSFAPVKKILDNEVQYFFDDFYAGKQEVEFLFRLTTPGIYPTPPVYVECMYEEEVFGRTGGRLFVIKEK